MRFIFCTKKDGRHIEYSNYFNTVIEAEIWYMNHGQWLEKTFNRKLELLKVHQGARELPTHAKGDGLGFRSQYFD